MTTQTTAHNPLLTVTGAARLLGVHVNTVRSWTDQGLLRCVRINARGDRRYSPADLQQFLARGARRPPGRRRAVDRAAEAPANGEAVLVVLRRIAEACAGNDDVQAVLPAVVVELQTLEYSAALAGGEGSSSVSPAGALTPDESLVGRIRASGHPAQGPRPPAGGRRQLGLPVAAGSPDDVLILEREEPGLVSPASELELIRTVSTLLAEVASAGQRRRVLQEQRRRAEILRTVSREMAAQLDPGHILRRLIDDAVELFGADRAGVLRRLPGGSFAFENTYNLSPEFCQALEHAPALALTEQAYVEGRVVSAIDYLDDPRSASLRHALLRERINTVTVAPLVSEGELLGVLALYHAAPYHCSADDLVLLEQFAQLGAAALKNASNYSQMATWAAQLQSIQQLGARLTRLNSVREIGQAIAAELNQLIDYHNVRVYRVEGDDVVPVAWRGEVGEYTGEDGEQLRVKVGQGITGWVARHGVAQNLGDAAADRRTETIPGTQDGLDESLLLAPMLYDDEVIGVIVLAKLGLNQFTADDLRLLEIYASIAAQAMANADVTEQLRAQSEALARQLQSQRELMRVTETIVSTLDTQALLGEIAVRLGSLLHVDNISVDLYDRQAGLVKPIFARGIHAAEYLAQSLREGEGLSGEVLRSGEALLVQDQRSDPRVRHFESIGVQSGALIVAPLHSRDEIRGLLTIERLGEGARFTLEEFELVRLFAGQVSIALQNAETHHAVELRAATDALTGLKNHGALNEHLARGVALGDTFSLLLIDLDSFKGYNDARGHEAGNVMLKRLADALRNSCRDSDDVFRYGGDEFAVILPKAAEAGALQVAEKLRSAVAAVDRRSSPRITCSIGVAVYPNDGDDRSDLLLSADRACYAAKREGGDRVVRAQSELGNAGREQAVDPAGRQPAQGAYSAA